jgi:hypothetical protein
VTNATNRPNQTQISVANDPEADHLIDVTSRSAGIRAHYG